MEKKELADLIEVFQSRFIHTEPLTKALSKLRRQAIYYLITNSLRIEQVNSHRKRLRGDNRDFAAKGQFC
ncbi:hypothetical protein Q1695_006265 [Nippostrongylus brasiliensis]|nr:hypothetical protein Q1695_006265 [Nippostrongylus brasiliensis]